MSVDFETGGRCWCCDSPYPAERMVHLGAHPEVTVCGDCARFLHRRAALLGSPRTPAALVRRLTGAVRDQVVARRIHERPVVGTLLRRLDRFLP